MIRIGKGVLIAEKRVTAVHLEVLTKFKSRVTVMFRKMLKKHLAAHCTALENARATPNVCLKSLHFLYLTQTLDGRHDLSLTTRDSVRVLDKMEDDDIPDTRLFVSGLPPHYTSEQLGAHFAGRYQITDSVVIPNRRIGFVGFRNYTLAKNAVKYFDKSYIRMSKISVEIAKPVDFHRELNSDLELEQQDVQNLQADKRPPSATKNGSSKSTFTPYESLTTKTSSKRKRADGEDQSLDMKECMDAVQSTSRTTWANDGLAPKAETPRAKNGDEPTEQGKFRKEKREKMNKFQEDTEPEAHAAETSEAEKRRRKKEKKEKKRLLEANAKVLDEGTVGEDKEARKKRKAEKKANKSKAESSAEGGVEPLNNDALAVDGAETDIAQPKIPRSDNDWLRGKTSRLLDLVDPNEKTGNEGDMLLKKSSGSIESSNEDESMDTDTEPDRGADNSNTAPTNDHLNAKAVAVPNGRIFVRNLPFSTVEADLESTFAKYGTIVEVSIPLFPQLALFRDDS